MAQNQSYHTGRALPLKLAIDYDLRNAHVSIEFDTDVVALKRIVAGIPKLEATVRKIVEVLKSKMREQLGCRAAPFVFMVVAVKRNNSRSRLLSDGWFVVEKNGVRLLRDAKKGWPVRLVIRVGPETDTNASVLRNGEVSAVSRIFRQLMVELEEAEHRALKTFSHRRCEETPNC